MGGGLEPPGQAGPPQDGSENGFNLLPEFVTATATTDFPMPELVETEHPQKKRGVLVLPPKHIGNRKAPGKLVPKPPQTPPPERLLALSMLDSSDEMEVVWLEEPGDEIPVVGAQPKSRAAPKGWQKGASARPNPCLTTTKPTASKSAPAKPKPCAKASIAKKGPSPKASIAKASPEKAAPAKAALAKAGPPKAGPAKGAPAKAAPAKAGPPKAGPPKAGPAKDAPAKIAPTKAAPAKAGLPKAFSFAGLEKGGSENAEKAGPEKGPMANLAAAGKVTKIKAGLPKAFAGLEKRGSANAKQAGAGKCPMAKRAAAGKVTKTQIKKNTQQKRQTKKTTEKTAPVAKKQKHAGHSARYRYGHRHGYSYRSSSYDYQDQKHDDYQKRDSNDDGNNYQHPWRKADSHHEYQCHYQRQSRWEWQWLCLVKARSVAGLWQRGSELPLKGGRCSELKEKDEEHRRGPWAFLKVILPYCTVIDCCYSYSYSYSLS